MSQIQSGSKLLHESKRQQVIAFEIASASDMSQSISKLLHLKLRQQVR